MGNLVHEVAFASCPRDDDGWAALLLADFLGCIMTSSFRHAASSLSNDGVMGQVEFLALRGGADDRDDVDWVSLHHPGSVIWPVVLALGGAEGINGSLASEAALRGYASAAALADLLRTVQRPVWHLTASAGAVGAASAAAVILQVDVETHCRAVALAAANAGGLSRAVVERGGAAAFNRAAAAVLGLAAARAASLGAAAVKDPVAGDGGLLEAMSLTHSGSVEVAVRDPLNDAAPRLFPVSGFLQGVASAVAAGRRGLGGELVAMRIGLTQSALNLVGGSDAGPWWDARAAAARVWRTGDPLSSGEAATIDLSLGSRIVVEAAPVGIGCARVMIETTEGAMEFVGHPMMRNDPDFRWALRDKWAHHVDDWEDNVLPGAQSAISAVGSPADLVHLWAK